MSDLYSHFKIFASGQFLQDGYDLSGFSILDESRCEEMSHVAALVVDKEVCAALMSLEIKHSDFEINVDFLEVAEPFQCKGLGRILLHNVFSYAVDDLYNGEDPVTVNLHGFSDEGSLALKDAAEQMVQDSFSDTINLQLAA